MGRVRFNCGYRGKGLMGAAEVFYQMANGEPIAAVEFDQYGKAAIRAFSEKADVSSVVHELSHVWRQDVLGEDKVTIQEHLGVKGGEWTVENEEQFAEELTQYIQTGKAPTPELQGVFQQFKDWLKHIYEWFQAEHDIPDEMRGVFDRMFATGEVQQVAGELQADIDMSLFDSADEFVSFAHTMYAEEALPDDVALREMWEAQAPEVAEAPARTAQEANDEFIASVDTKTASN